MIVSLNEIEMALRKAGLGAGLPHGLAYELGNAGGWLAASGLPVLPLALAALHSVDRGNASPALDASPGVPVSACHAGPAIVALLDAGACADPLRVGRVDAPCLVVAHAACSGRDTGRTYALAWSDAQGEVQVRVQGGEMLCNRTPDAAAGAAADMTVATAPAAPLSHAASYGTDAQRRRALDHGVPVDDGDWEALQRFARRTLVAATARSRAVGAGAGLVDAD